MAYRGDWGAALITTARPLFDAEEEGTVGETNDIPGGGLFEAKGPSVNIAAIVVSVLILVIMLSWFDVLHALYDETFPPQGKRFYRVTLRRAGYALLITVICVPLIIIIMHWRHLGNH